MNLTRLVSMPILDSCDMAKRPEIFLISMAAEMLEKCRGAKAITVEISAENPPKE